MTAAVKRRPGRPIVPGSRQQRRAAADKVLRGLLRTPKTRIGLIAGAGMGKNFVYGWLSEAMRRGDVVSFKSSGIQLLYQMAECVVHEVPSTQSDYPPWLEPRVLPTFGERRVFVDAQDVRFKQPDDEEEDDTSDY